MGEEEREGGWKRGLVGGTVHVWVGSPFKVAREASGHISYLW